MYTIYVDGKLLYAPLLFHEGGGVYSPRLTLELNRAGSLEFVLPHNNVLYNSINKLKSVITVFKDEEEIFRGRVLHDEKDFYKQKRVYCEGELAYLIDSIQRPYKFEGNAETLFGQLISNHNSRVDKDKQFMVGRVTVNETIKCESKNYQNTYDEINTQIIDISGGHLKPRLTNGVRYLDLIAPDAESGEVNIASQTIEFGINLLDITEYITAEDMFTVLIPLGGTVYDSEGNVVSDKLTIASVNSDKDYLEDTAAIELFGRIERTEEWNDIEKAEDLLTIGRKFLENNIAMAVSLTVKAIDLNLLSSDYERIRVGDWVRVISLPHDLDRTFQCTKIIYNLENPDQNEYTFGYSASSLTERQVAGQKQVQILSSLKTDISQLLNGGGTGGSGGGGETGGLPSGYTRVNYIEGTGTQYIDSGITNNSSNDIVLQADISFDKVVSSTQIMGFNGNAGNGIGLSGGSWWEINNIEAPTDETRYTIEWGVNGTNWYRTISGITVSGSRSIYSFNTNLYLFAAQESSTSTVISYHCSFRMHSSRIIVDGAVVRDYIPCINPSNEAGLYDLVTKTFYGNAGTGTFTTG